MENKAPLRVVVQGASGRMGQVMVNALCREPEMQVVGAVELKVSEDYLPLPNSSGSVPFSSNLDHILTGCQPDVLAPLLKLPCQQCVQPLIMVLTW